MSTLAQAHPISLRGTDAIIGDARACDVAVDAPALACAALLLEAAFGFPKALVDRIGHPVMWMGWVIDHLERALNRADWRFARRRLAGTAALLILLGVTIGATLPFTFLIGGAPGWIFGGLLAASLPAQRSLGVHVRAVADALDHQGLEAGRSAVSQIVGRNPEVLDEAGVARAAIESLAENFSDGIVAPALWLAAGGLPAGALYKAINTADSMIGHRSARFEAFGWAAARLDDLVNLPASRLSALLLTVAALVIGADPRAALHAVRRDARHHRSPNAGWPEAAMGGALDLALAGPRVYGAVRVDDRFIGGSRQSVTSADIRRALQLYRAACALQIAALVLLAVALSII